MMPINSRLEAFYIISQSQVFSEKEFQREAMQGKKLLA